MCRCNADGEIKTDTLANIKVSRPALVSLHHLKKVNREFAKSLPPTTNVEDIVEPSENDVYGRVTSLQDTLEQLLSNLFPDEFVDIVHPEDAFEFVRASKDKANIEDADVTMPGWWRESKLQEGHHALVVLLGCDGVRISIDAKQFTLFHLGLAQLRVMQQSPKTWCLLGAIEDDEDSDVICSLPHAVLLFGDS